VKAAERESAGAGPLSPERTSAEPVTVERFAAWMDEHVSAEELAKQALAHRRATCPEAARAFAQVEARRAERAWLDPARFARAEAPAPAPGAEEVAAARRDLRLLSEKRGADRLALVGRDEGRMNGRALADLLLAEAKALLQAAEPSAGEALSYLDCALAVLERTPRHTLAPGELPRRRVRLQAQRANALRILGQLPAADAVWRELHEPLATWPLARGEEAEIWSFEASLRRALRQFELAEKLLRRAEGLYRSAGDERGLARACINLGNTVDYGGEPDRALTFYQEALLHIEEAVDPRLYWTTRKNLADSLINAGRLTEATQHLAALRPYFGEHGTPGDKLRLAWVEGKLARAEKRWEDAERKLQEAAIGFLTGKRRQPFDAALVQLDLAELHLARGRPREVRRLAEAMAPVFAEKRVHREAFLALRLFRDAAAAERLTAAGIAEVRRFLAQARLDPAFAFEPREVSRPLGG
jgi:tetratricopeptide (TPR) repeat protein